mgnify:FL=1
MTIDQHTTPDPGPPAAPRRDLPAEGGASAPEAVQAADVDRGSRDTKELEVERPARGGGGLGAPFRLAFAGEWSVGAQRCRLPGRTRAARPVGDRRRGQGVGFARAAACPVVCLRARRARC